MTNVSSSRVCVVALVSSVFAISAVRRFPADSLNFSSLLGDGCSVSRSRGCAASATEGVGGAGAGVGGSSLGDSETGRLGDSSFFLLSAFFFRIFTKSTMRVRLHPVLFCRGGDAGRVDGLGVFAEGIEECGRREGVDEARDAAAQRVNLFHRLAVEGIARAAGDADAVLDRSEE